MVRTPVSPDRAAEMFDAMLTGAREDERVIDNDYSGHESVAFSGSRSRVIISLLEELSLRTEPGRAVGPIESNGRLSRLAREMAGYLRAGY